MSFDYSKIEHPALSAFANVAREFCSLIEGHTSIPSDEFVTRLHLLLPLLYVSGLKLPSVDVLFDEDETGDEEDESEAEVYDGPTERSRKADDSAIKRYMTLMRSLEGRLGAMCYYREVFDPYDPEEEPEVTGSLADDLADIYLDLARGLRQWDSGETGDALWEWRFGLEEHWGEHLTGALRAIHAGACWHDGVWPTGAAEETIRGP